MNSDDEKMSDTKGAPKGGLDKIGAYFPMRAVIGMVSGAVLGFIYYKTVGCSSGGCAITSNPWLTVLWGSIFGYLIGDMFKKKSQQKND